MPSLCCSLKCHSAMQIAWDDSLRDRMTGLQGLIGGTLRQDDDTADFVMESVATRDNADLVYQSERQRFTCRLIIPSTTREQVLVWRGAMTCAAGARLLRGEKLCLMHGCLLTLPSGEGLFLCGQSGMGKSTTAQRWKAAGGECPADDLVLMEWDGDNLFAHPLPTWSRCLTSLDGEWYPFEEPLQIKTVLSLSRDELEEAVRPVEPFKYMSALYASCSLFNMEVAKNLPPEAQKRFINKGL